MYIYACICGSACESMMYIYMRVCACESMLRVYVVVHVSQ